MSLNIYLYEEETAKHFIIIIIYELAVRKLINHLVQRTINWNRCIFLRASQSLQEQLNLSQSIVK